jgi:hypothetical protein
VSKHSLYEYYNSTTTIINGARVNKLSCSSLYRFFFLIYVAYKALIYFNFHKSVACHCTTRACLIQSNFYRKKLAPPVQAFRTCPETLAMGRSFLFGKWKQRPRQEQNNGWLSIANNMFIQVCFCGVFIIMDFFWQRCVYNSPNIWKASFYTYISVVFLEKLLLLSIRSLAERTPSPLMEVS